MSVSSLIPDPYALFDYPETGGLNNVTIHVFSLGLKSVANLVKFKDFIFIMVSNFGMNISATGELFSYFKYWLFVYAVVYRYTVNLY